MLTRIVAKLKGQVRVSTLDAHRRAGDDIPSLLDEAVRALDDPWQASEQLQIVTLCAWNAFMCHLVANSLLDAESHEDRSTAGYVPPGLATDALTLYREAESWRRRAIEARTSRTFSLDISAPDVFPLWIDSSRSGASVPRGLLWALQSVVARREAFERVVAAAPAERWEAAEVLQEMFVRVAAAGDYAARMWSDTMSSDVRAEVSERLRSAIANAYVLGQLVAMPQLAESRKALARTLEDNRVIHQRAALNRRTHATE